MISVVYIWICVMINYISPSRQQRNIVTAMSKHFWSFKKILPYCRRCVVNVSSRWANCVPLLPLFGPFPSSIFPQESYGNPDGLWLKRATIKVLFLLLFAKCCAILVEYQLTACPCAEAAWHKRSICHLLNFQIAPTCSLIRKIHKKQMQNAYTQDTEKEDTDIDT